MQDRTAGESSETESLTSHWSQLFEIEFVSDLRLVTCDFG